MIGSRLLLFLQQLGRGLGVSVKIGLRGPFFHFHVAFFDKTQFFQHRDSSQFNIISIISAFFGVRQILRGFLPILLQKEVMRCGESGRYCWRC